jgi:NADH-quinone oxidoreductase subunit N
MDLNNLASLTYFYPESLLTAGVLILVLLDLVIRNKSFLGDLALVVTAASLLLIALEPRLSGAWLFNRMLVFDSFAVFFRALISLAAIVAVWMSMGSEEVRHCDQGEYYALLLASTLGMFLMATSANLLMAYLSLEFVSLTSYVLTGFLKHNRRSQEAALKYLIYGGVASGTMIYGMSWIYGIAGSLDFSVINRALTTAGHVPVLTVFIALVLILAGMGYKIASVPFHMWAPDVYEGAPIPITTFLAVASKAAGFALLTRFFYPAISHLAYLFAYYIMDAGAFLVVMIVANETGREDIAAYRGLAWRGGAVPAIALGIFLLSLTGIPATIGFIGKFYVFAAAIQEKFYVLAVIGILNSVVSLYYYMRPVKAMFLDQPNGDEGPVRIEIWNYGLMGVLAIATIVLGLYPPPVIAFASRSLHFFLGPA